ncbi:MAG: hypothetical protein ACI89X_001628 [Planctomycetota bacterium]|jgi:hypothetical protein
MPSLSVRTVLCALLLSITLAAQGGATENIRKLLSERDDADIKLIEKIGRERSREAAEGLIKAYDKCVTLLFRREIAKTLAWFGNLPDSQQPALDKLAEIAGGSQEEELRRLALRGLAQSHTIGKQLLQRIIDSKASDELREPAMVEHVKLAAATDADWYREVWNLQKKQRKDENGDIMAPELNAIRLLAFKGALPYLSEAELVQTLKRDADSKIRRMALEWMERKSMPKALSMAEMILGRVTYFGGERSVAARMIAEAKGPKAMAGFLKLAKKRDVTQEDLRREMARLISTFDDKKTQKRAAGLIGKGKPHEKVFALLATVKINTPKALTAVRKCLKDKDVSVRRAAGEALAARRDRQSVPALRALMAKAQGPEDIRIALEAINAIEGPMSAWLKEIAGYTTYEDRDVRNAAMEVLRDAHDKRQLEPLMVALEHPDWSTRLLAIQAMAGLKQASTVGKLVERMNKESGRMKKQLAAALWELTAQPFDEDEDKWAAWWKVAKKDFKIASRKEMDAAKKARERRRLTQRTVSKAKFFGIKVESHRVIFVLDVSGSMMESMYGREVNGRGATRIDIAKQELTKAVENLDPGALFNILTFSSGVARWMSGGIVTSNDASREEAKTWIERLGAGGGTNLYDSVREAFKDKDVDTVFILSDGEPTTGEVLDPFRIREDVARWNKHRKIKINTIAIGGNLEVLEWLAQDAGGKYRQMR